MNRPPYILLYLRMQEPTICIAALWQESAHLLRGSSCWCCGSYPWKIWTRFTARVAICKNDTPTIQQIRRVTDWTSLWRVNSWMEVENTKRIITLTTALEICTENKSSSSVVLGSVFTKHPLLRKPKAHHHNVTSRNLTLSWASSILLFRNKPCPQNPL